ncbi:MAG TPA: hypothetical protein VJO53_08140 [Candidatus Acidoferrales bacterium]|nr:hypothetical protein [Candidatus Acidoferrales bacterium]
MLKKSYPMRYHEDRPFSVDQLYPDKETYVPDPEERGECRRRNTSGARPVNVALAGPNEHAEAARRAAAQNPAACPNGEAESSEDENPYPTTFAVLSNWPPDHHRRHCTVCNHPFRSAIEEEFLHWASPDAISHHYSVGWRSVYRHAHALGLFEQRGRNLRSALGNIIEHSNHVAPTADNVVRAIRAYACVNKSGKWIEPTKHVEFSSPYSTGARRPRKGRKSEALPDASTISVTAEQTPAIPSAPLSRVGTDAPSRVMSR